MAGAALKVSIAYFIISYLDPFVLSWQTLNRPMVVAPLTGLILGDFKTGIVMGASLEGIFMGISAIGGQIPADATTASIISVAFTVLTGGDTEAGIAISLPIGTAIASFNAMLSPVWASLAPYWESVAHQPRKFLAQILGFTALQTLIPTALLYISVAFGVESLNTFLASMPDWVMNGLGAASGMLLAVGFAMLTSMVWTNEIGYFFIIGFILAKILGLDALTIALVGGVIAVTLFMIDKNNLELKKQIETEYVNVSNDEEDFF